MAAIPQTVSAAKSMCCGCGLCAAECPVHAIRMVEDELGYAYPSIDLELCIGCQSCVAKCVMNKPHEYPPPLASYAGIRNDKEQLKASSSGGIFAAVAECVIKTGGMVCGATIDKDFSVNHVLISSEGDLKPLLGSKYVQSDILSVFQPIREALGEGREVLFSGTPCQVDAIKTYTGDPGSLLTMEVVCHGVPNVKMFQEYIHTLESKPIRSFVFRDKGQGWSFNHRVDYEDGTRKKINHRLSSYMTFFMKGCLYRESCFHCPYAQKHRNADITIGDFWGIARKRPDLLRHFRIDDGVSCVLANTEKGKARLLDADISLHEVAYDDIVEGNGPLKHPSSKGKDITHVIDLWRSSQKWKPIERFWQTKYCKLRFKAWALLPKSWRNGIRMILKLR